jgi:hypothetical protein
MTQKQAIFNALLSGEVLTTLKGVKEFGTVKLPTRIDELERKHKFYCKRKKIKFKTRYGTAGYYYEYQMKSTDRKSLRKLFTTKTK